jgi:hypothetical protein
MTFKPDPTPEGGRPASRPDEATWPTDEEVQEAADEAARVADNERQVAVVDVDWALF